MIGPRELVVVLLVTLLLYGRSGLRSPGVARMLRPRPGPRAAAARARAKAWRDRLSARGFWALTIIAATAVAAWIVTRMLLVGAPGASR